MDEPDRDDDENSIRVTPPTPEIPHGREATTVEIAGEERVVEAVVDLERLRVERSAVWSYLLRTVGDETTRTIYVALLSGAGTYDELTAWTNVGRQATRKRVYDLRDANVVEITGNPAVVRFVDEDVRLLTSDALSFL